ncbi:hypothetical protein COCON_G00229290 [Conger conger]|uniref:triacylglycerol lipase n=1 Tax=Conger conger TaxID=82655 RepID=A0A9Q1CVA2_CONCO|nr:hypothetical protein COCON_G00229290 [Conger conger]
MFDFERDWSVSFAGCGFLGIYYVGLVSCFLERAPFLLMEARKMYGASSGALIATVLILGLPLVNCCEDLMAMAKAARRRSLGPLHPSCDLEKIVRDSLNRDLPADAHVRASGRLCVSLTRMSDGQNVLLSEFATRQELIQALVCSCFVPGYFGLIPPSFRGVRYMDGALSNNQPQYQRVDTLTVAPFCGDCVICPRDRAFSLHAVRVCGASYRVSLPNVRRVARVFFPPQFQVMAELCQDGYKDGLQFLKEHHLLGPDSLPAELSSPGEEEGSEPAGCCGDENDALQSWTNEMESSMAPVGHWWLDKRTIDCLPESIRKVLCEACREKHSLYSGVTELFPVRMASYILLPYTLPVQSAYCMAQRLVRLVPVVVDSAQWLLKMCGDLYRQTWKAESLEDVSEAPLLRDRSPARDRSLGEDDPPLPLTPPPTPPPTPPRRRAAETTETPESSDFVSMTAVETAPPPPPTATNHTWALCVTWAVGLLSPVTLDPTL